MKLSKLFVLGAMGLVSLTASAADFTLERTEPVAPETAPLLDGVTPEQNPVDFVAGKVYVLYNVGEGKYFSQGCAWATQASTSSLPIAVRFSLPEGKSLADAALLFNDYNRYTNSWKEVFFDSETAMFTDRNNQGVSYFNVIPQGSKVYRIQASAENATWNPTAHPGFLGRDLEVTYTGDSNGRDVGTSDAQPVSPFLAEGEGHYLDWQFFEVPELSEWNDYFVAQEVFKKSEALKALIEKAEEAGVDVTAAVAVYNDESSTIEQMDQAMTTLNAAIAAQSGIGNGTADSPSDATSLINNPNFDNASSTGWSGNSPNMVGAGSHGPANVAEFYQGSNVDMYQELSGLPNGVYRMQMYGMYRSGNPDPAYQNYLDGTNYRAKLYASADGGMLTADIVNPFEIQNKTSFAGDTDFGTSATESMVNGFYIPNDPSCARVYFNQGWYLNTLFFYVSDGKARIGVREDGANIGGDWFPFDEFTLNYFGNTEASFGKWVELSAANYDNVMVTLSLLESYKSNVASLTASAKDKASAVAAVAQLKEEAALLKANSALWAKWLAALDEALAFTTGEYSGLKAASTLDEYIGWEAQEQKEEPTWNNDEIEASIAKINQMIEAVKAEKMNSVNVGEDVTDLYIGKDDAEFANGQGGWTIEGDGCKFGSGAAEAYDQQFDIYKEIESVNAAGVYELQLQGFFRLERDQTAFDMYGRGEQDKTRAWIYMNDVKSYVGCVFDEKVTDGVFENGDNAGGGYWTYEDVNAGSTYWYPNTMGSAAECFNHDMYKVKAYGLVANAGDALRIGVAGNMKGANWMIWDKFKLTYVGYDAATISPILEEALAAMPSLDDPMGKDVYENALTVKAAAEAAMGGSDGKAMFNALKDLWEASAQIDASVALFAKLKTAAEGLNELLSSSANEDAINEAGPFVEQLNADIKDHKYNDEDVPGLMKQIKGFRYMLRMPAEIVVGTDLTNILEVPEYSNEDGAASSEGWDGTTAAVNAEVMNAEIFNAEEFDHYQEIPGLPAGQYKVTVMAFYRAGNGPADYAALQEGKDSCDNVVLYANNEKVTLHRLAEFADGAHFGEDAWIEVAENSGLYVPNSMSTAAILFDEQDLTNTVIGTVGADGVLRLGLKKEIHITDDWCLFDNWKLEYVGEGAPSIKGDTNGDGKVDVADISQVIAVMAAGGYSAVVDVNADDVVDVADISQVISIMAANARLAKAIEE